MLLRKLTSGSSRTEDGRLELEECKQGPGQPVRAGGRVRHFGHEGSVSKSVSVAFSALLSFRIKKRTN